MIVVTGTPRSGTSIMMRTIADAIGSDRLVAAKWPGRTRAAKTRDMNPDGFWESRYTMRGITWHQGIEANAGKLTKVVSHGLARSNPAYVDRLVVMTRSPRRVARSQERLHRTPLRVDVIEQPEGDFVVHDPTMFVTGTAALAAWLAENPKPVLLIDHDDLVDQSDRELRRLAHFLDLDAAVFAGHRIRPSLRRSQPRAVEHHLWPLADRFYEALRRGDWPAIVADYRANAALLHRGKAIIPCARLREKMAESECVNCLHNRDTRRTFRDRAESKRIDWRREPCNYLAAGGPDRPAVPAAETVAANHWDDTLAPPPPPLTACALRYLASTARLIGEAARGRAVTARKDVIVRRLAACRSCSYRSGDRCHHPGCGCRIQRKARRPTETCPADRWPTPAAPTS